MSAGVQLRVASPVTQTKRQVFGSQPGLQDILIDIPFLLLWVQPPIGEEPPRRPDRRRPVALVVDSIGPAFCTAIVMVVTMNLRWVGILIVNSMLIVPAAGSRNIARNARQYVFYAVGIALFSGIVGLIASFYTNTATGATIVLAAMGCFIVTLGVKATRGITASANRDEVNGKSVVRVRNG